MNGWCIARTEAWYRYSHTAIRLLVTVLAVTKKLCFPRFDYSVHPVHDVDILFDMPSQQYMHPYMQRHQVRAHFFKWFVCAPEVIGWIRFNVCVDDR